MGSVALASPEDLDAIQRLKLGIVSNFRPRKRMKLSDWAEENIILSSEYSAKASKLRLYGWQREIFDSYTTPEVTTVTLVCGVQMTKTLFGQCALSYTIVEEPGPILFIQPTEDDAKSFSKERLSPMRRDCPALKGKLPETEKGGNTLMFKEFPGGSLALIGAQVAGKFARRAIKVIIFDEPDKYPESAGKEGDPIALGIERTMTFKGRKKILQMCSPTIAGRSRIWKSYLESDMRKPWVPCWKCGALQVLNFKKNVMFNSKLTPHEAAVGAYLRCDNPECGVPWNEYQRLRACEQTVWIAEQPFIGHAGFWISHLYSPYKSIYDLVLKFMNAQTNVQELKAFINTNLAELWEEQGTSPNPDTLYGRREDYPFNDDAVAPRGVLFLTAAVDVQDNPPRLEVEVVGWGRNGENWSLAYYVIEKQAENGEPLPVTSKELWDELYDKILMRDWPHENGATLPIMVMAIDTGKRPKPVYEFALRCNRIGYDPSGIKLYAPRTVVPIKGNDDDQKIISKISKEDAARKRQNIRIVSIGTHFVKQEIYDILPHVKPNEDGSPTPGCYHFPYYQSTYFDGVSSEIRIIDKDGDVAWIKKPGVRNEPLDLKVYNRGAASIAGIDRLKPEQWDELERRVGVRGDEKDAEPAPQLGPSSAVTPDTAPHLSSSVQETVQSASQFSAGRRIRGRF